MEHQQQEQIIVQQQLQEVQHEQYKKQEIQYIQETEHEHLQQQEIIKKDKKSKKQKKLKHKQEQEQEPEQEQILEIEQEQIQKPQQQQEHEQIVVEQEETIIKKDLKLIKPKKALEEHVQSLEEENLDTITTPTFETLTLQSLPQETVESVPIAELPFRAPEEKPKPQLAQEKFILQQSLLVKEKDQLMELEKPTEIVREITEIVSETVESVELIVPSTQEIVTEEKSQLLPKDEREMVKASAKQDLQPRKPLVVEKPLIEETTGEELTKVKLEQFASPQVSTLQAQQQTQVILTDSIDKLEDKLASVKGQQVKTEIIEESSIVVEEVFAAEPKEKELITQKPKAIDASQVIVPSESTVEIEEVLPHDTTKDWKKPKEQPQEKTDTIFVPHKSIVAKEVITQDSEQLLEEKPLALTAKASETVKEIPHTLEILETKTNEMVQEQPITKTEPLAKANEKLVLQESIQASQPEQQSPIEEYKTSYMEIKKQASLAIDEQKHITGLQEFIDEPKPQDFAVPEMPLNQAKLQQELKPQPAKEVSQIQTTEHAEELKPLESTTPQKGKPTLTNGNIIGESQQTQLYENVLESQYDMPAPEQVKSQLDIMATVANITEIQLQDKEDLLKQPEKQFSASAKTSITEQPNAVTIFSQQPIESEEQLKAMEKPEMQMAQQQENLRELKAPLVDLTETQANTKPLEDFKPQELQAAPNVDLNIATLTSDTTLMDTHALIEPKKEEHLNIKSQFITNKSNLDIYEVTINESFKEQPLQEKPITHQALVQQDEHKLKSLETREVVILETSTDSDIKLETTNITATTNLKPQIVPETSTQIQYQLTGDLKDLKQPDEQQSQTEFEVIQPLEIVTTQTHEREINLPEEEKPSTKQVTTSSTNLLNIAQTFKEQTVEHSDDLTIPEMKVQSSRFNLVEGIPTALSSVTEGMDSIEDYNSQTPNATQLTHISIVENKALSGEIVTANEKEAAAKEFRQPAQLSADTKFSDELFKAPLVKEEESYESSNKFTGIISLEAQVQIKETDNLRELLVGDINVYETEKSLDVVDLSKTQEAQLNITTQPQVALTHKEQLLEGSEDFKAKPFTTDLAQVATHDINLKLPLTEGVLQQDTVTKLKEFESSTLSIKPTQKLLNETITSEALVLESFETKDLKLSKKEEYSKEILQDTNKYAVVEDKATVLEQEQLLDKVLETPKQALQALTDTRNLPVSLTQGLMENIDNLKDLEKDLHTAKLMADEKALVVGTTQDKSLLFDSVAETQLEKQIAPVKAQIDHVGQQGVLIETQQPAEFEGILAPVKPELTEVPVHTIPQEHRLPLIEETKTQELTGNLQYTQPISSTADSIIQDANKELTITEIQTIEESTILDYQQKPSTQVHIALDERFKPAQVETLTDVLQKEELLKDFKPNTDIAKPFVEGTLREMIITMPTAYEETPELTSPQTLTTKAKTFTEDTAKQTHLQHIQTIMQSEDKLSSLPQDKYQAKSFIEGSQREVQVSQVTTLENVDNLEKPLLQEQKAVEIENNSTRNIHTMMTTTVFEKETNITTEKPKPVQTLEPTSKEETNEKLITEIVAFEGTAPLQDSPVFNTQLAKVSLTTSSNEIKQIQDQTVYVKEADVEKFSLKSEKATLVQDKLKAVLAEETIGLSSITETYELTKRDQQHANIVKDTPNLQAQLVQSTIAYEEPTNLKDQLNQYERTQPISIDKETKSIESHIIQTFENIGEESGDFKPNIQDSKASLVLPDLKASMVEETLTQIDVSELDILQQTKQIQPVHSHQHSDKLITSTVTPFETLENLKEKDQLQQKATVGLTDLMITSTSLEPQTSTIVGELDRSEPKSYKPHTEIQMQSTYMYETQIIPNENTQSLQTQINEKAVKADTTTTETQHAYLSSTTNSYENTAQIAPYQANDDKIQPILTLDELKTALNTTHLTSDTLTDLQTGQKPTTLQKAHVNLNTNLIQEQISYLVLETEQLLAPTPTPNTQNTQTKDVPQTILEKAKINTTISPQIHKPNDTIHYTDYVNVIDEFTDIENVESQTTPILSTITESHDDHEKHKTYTVTFTSGKYIQYIPIIYSTWRSTCQGPIRNPTTTKNTLYTFNKTIDTYKITTITLSNIHYILLHRYHTNSHTRTHRNTRNTTTNHRNARRSTRSRNHFQGR